MKTRDTKQRQAVLSALDAATSFCTAQELHDVLRHRGDKVGLATVYRSLQMMADSDDVDVIRSDGGEALYRRCSSQHHHHLVCRACGRTVEVSGPAVESWAERVASQHGFRDVSHTVELSGVCSSCQ